MINKEIIITVPEATASEAEASHLEVVANKAKLETTTTTITTIVTMGVTMVTTVGGTNVVLPLCFRIKTLKSGNYSC